MAKQVSISAQKRTETGKGAAGRLRRDGRVPAIMYGYQVEPTTLHLDALELYHALHTEVGVNALLAVDVDGDLNLAIAREIQRHPVRGEITHVDLLAVDKEAKIGVEVPIHALNTNKVEPGVVQVVLNALPILVKPLEVPASFDIDVSEMEIGDVVRAGDIPLPAGAEVDIDPTRTVITINPPMGLEDLETGEEAGEGEAGEEMVDADDVEEGEGDAEPANEE